MTFKLTSTVACLSLALSLGAPRLVSASPSESEAPLTSPEAKTKIGLVVDASKIDEEFQPQLEIIAMRQLRPALEKAGYEVSDGVVDLALRVRFAPVDAGQFRDHGVHFEFVRAEGSEPAIPWVLCNACGQVRLEGILAESAPQLIAAVDKAIASGRAQSPEEGPQPDGPVDDTTNDPKPVDLPKPIGPIGISGGVVAALGLGALVWGAVELSRGVEVTPPVNERQRIVNHRPRGTALVATGAASLAVGAILLGVDLGLRSKKRKQARSKATVIAPIFSPQHVGIGVAGRF